MKEIFRLIPREYHRGCLKVALSVPLQAVLNLVGAAALLPVLLLLQDASSMEQSFPGRLAGKMGIPMDGSFSIAVILAVVAVLILKTLLSVLITDYQNRFLLKLFRNMSSRLFVSLYSRGLLYVKNNSSARMAYNVTGVCYSFVVGYLGGLMELLGQVVFIVMLLSTMLLWFAKATLVAVCALVPAIVLYVLMVRKPLIEMGKMENEARRDQNRLLNEAFRGYSEVRVNDAFPSISRRLDRVIADISSYRTRIRLVQSIPNYLLELSIVAVMAVLLLFSMKDPSSMDPVFLGVLAVALLKLLPSARTIVGSVSVLSSTAYTREVISEINCPSRYRVMHDDAVEPMKFERQISVEDVSFSFDDGEKAVLEHINLTIPKGTRLGIQGRTGSGKTTLFNLLLGLYPPTEGRIVVDGEVLTAENLLSWHEIVGYVPQEVFVADSTILENVALGMEPGEIDGIRAMEALEQASLGAFVRSLPKGAETRIGEAGCRLSGGQRQRLGIARALYKKASVLFFDEATSSLDDNTEKEVSEAIRKLSEERRELTMIIISHRKSSLAFCDRIFELE